VHSGWTPGLRILSLATGTWLRLMLIAWAFSMAWYGLLDWRLLWVWIWCLAGYWLVRIALP